MPDTTDTAAPRSKLYGFFHSATLRGLTGAVLLMAIYTAIQMLWLGYVLDWDFTQTPPDAAMYALPPALAATLVLPPVYALYYGWLEKRRVDEMALSLLPRHLATGLFCGIALQALTVAVMLAAGAAQIMGVNPLSSLVPAIGMALGAAVFEEILFRGVIFRLLQEKTGTYVALLVSGALFGLMHIGNPNATLGSALMIAVEAGILLGAAYTYTGALWLPIGLHFGWNFAQSGIFSANTSGITLPEGLLQMQYDGPDWLTGGAFGPEATVQAVVFCLALAALFLLGAQRKGRIVPFGGAARA